MVGWLDHPTIPEKGAEMNEQDCYQEERINRMERAVERIEEQVHQLVMEFSSLKGKMEQALQRQNDHQEVLYGMKGTTGLLGWKEKAAETLEELKLALKGYGDEPGLIAEIRALAKKIDEWDDTKKWLIRLVGALIVTEVLKLVFAFYK